MKNFDFINRKLNLGKLLGKYGKSCWHILESSLPLISFLCMVIAVILFLGRLFHKIQPWFSEIQGLFLILFGLFAFWDAHRIYKRLSVSSKKVWSNYQYRFAINTGVISIIASPVAFFISRRKYTDFPWFPIILFVLGFGLFCLFAYRVGFFKEIFELSKESYKEISTEKSPSIDPIYLGQIMGSSIVGLSYLIIFLPLTLWNTAIHNLDCVDVLLFATLTNTSAKLGILGQINTLLDFSNMSHLFAFGVFYGVVAIIRVLIKISIKKEGMAEFVIMSNGIFYGYFLTIWIKHYFGASLTLAVLFSSALSFGYVALLYYGLRSLLDVASKWGIRSKYEYGIGGIQSIGTAWILSRVFGDQAIIFSGVIFFICTFITTCIFEVTIGRIIKKMHPLLPDNLGGSIVPIILSLARERNTEFWISMCSTIIVFSIFPFFAFGIFKLVLMAL